jgi:hypothetical protein
VLGTATYTDNCSATLVDDAPTIYPLGNTTVTYTLTDIGGNVVTYTQTVTVVDTQAPVLDACPGNISVCEGTIVTFNDPTANDNCSATVTQIAGPSSGDSLAAGTYTVTYVADDASGNTDTCSFSITINANPVVTLSLTFSTVCVDDGAYALQGEFPFGGTYSGTAVSGGNFDPAVAGVGNFTITYMYTDTNGCSGSATDNLVVSLCTGVNENGQQTFSIFPNPASDNLVFESNEAGVVVIYDATGKAVMNENVTAGRNDLNVSELAAGSYNVQFTNGNGNVSNGQLLIQR